MKLSEFSVTNYRSILTTEKFSLGDLTVLVGPNNEGKSNLLRALDIGISYLRGWSTLPLDYGQSTAPHLLLAPRMRNQRSREGSARPYIYDYGSDFPRNHKKYDDGTGATTIRLNFTLSEDEAREFKDVTGSHNNGHLPVKLTLTKRSVRLEIVKPGPGNSVLAAKSVKIADRIVKGLDFHYIPAVRASENATQLVTGLVRRKLRALSLEEEYAEHASALDKMRSAALREVHKTLETSLAHFLPALQSVRLETYDTRDLMRVSNVYLNDGAETPLENKGDGVQSLAAISLMQETAALSSAAETMVLAIEEPESHLHPEAVHQVRQRLESIAQNQQVVITTHSPLLVNRSRVSSNIIVEKNRARSAQSLDQVRTCLGVRVTDNLHSADLAVLVEGTTDKRALAAYFSHRSHKVSRALLTGRLAIIAVRGASSLESRLSALQATITPVYVAFDKDQSGQKAIQNAIDLGLLRHDSYIVFNTPGMREAELEDMYSLSVTLEAVDRVLGIQLTSADFGRRNTKWSNRLERALNSAGKVWDEQTVEDIKIAAAKIAELAPEVSYEPNWSKVLETATMQIEAKLDSLG